MPEISVIVPVYRVEPYLKRCIDSILNQDFRDIEVILVDDGSPDNCGAICDEYAGADSRVRVIHKPNGGLSSARNAGMEIASGEYLSFIDSDDYILPGMYTKLYNLANTHGLEVAMCSAHRVTDPVPEPSGSYWVLCKDRIDIFPHTTRRDFMYSWCVPGRICTVWNKLYRREFLERIGISFTVVFSEDAIFSTEIAARAQAIGSVSEAYYCYVDRPGSILYKSALSARSKHLDLRLETFRRAVESQDCRDEVMAYAAVRAVMSIFHGLKLQNAPIEDICRYADEQIKRLNLMPLLNKAAEPEIFSDYARVTGMTGEESENFKKLIGSMTGGYDTMLA